MDCTRATFAILRDVYGPIVDTVSPALHIRNPGDPFSNVDAVAGLGLGEIVSHPGAGWSLCQGWRQLEPLHGGHIQPWCERRTWGEQKGKFPAGVKVCQLREVSYV
jgi:hypothetical protein